MNAPEHKDEGSTKRTNFSLSGPLGGDFSFRLFGNLDKTQADARYQPGPSVRAYRDLCRYSAGRARRGENKTSMVWCAGNSLRCSRWSLRPATAAVATSTPAIPRTPTQRPVKENYGKETNRLYRNTYSVTERRRDNGVTTSNWAQYERTRNSRKGGDRRRHRGSLTATSSRISIWRM